MVDVLLRVSDALTFHHRLNLSLSPSLSLSLSLSLALSLPLSLSLSLSLSLALSLALFLCNLHQSAFRCSRLLLVNTLSQRCLCSLDPHPESRLSNKKAISFEERQTLLMKFYTYVVGNLWELPVLEENTESTLLSIGQ